MNEDLKNHRAWEMLDEALFVSSHIKAEERDRGETDWDNVYPVSAEETDRMEELLNKAVEAADDPQDENFRNRVDDLREIIDYSRTRHRTWKWAIIGGAVLAAAFFWWCNSSNEDDVNEAKSLVAKVEAWEKSDTTIAYDCVPASVDYGSRYNSAAAYKLYQLSHYKSQAESSAKYAQECTQKADTASTKEAKKKFLDRADESTQRAADAMKEYKEMEQMEYKDIKKTALQETNKSLGYKNSAKNSTLRWMIFLCVLIPLYIISGYSLGYVITAHRKRQNFLDKLQTWGFAIGGFFFGAGFAMSLLPEYKVTTTYSNGHKETSTEPNMANIIVLGLKIGLMIVGAFVFSFVSVLIMTVQTISGLKNNFNWQPLISKAKQQAEQIKNKQKA